jgi:uncharacterized protein YecE (DUF72 family)
MAVRCGIAGWIDKSLIDSKLFYPLAVTSAEERLGFYASQFSVVEADTTYYGMPKPENSERWAARTPAGFLFDVKSFSLFTHHPTKAMALTPDLRDELPDNLREKKPCKKPAALELVDGMDRFRPLGAAGGQPTRRRVLCSSRWFVPSSRCSPVEQVREDVRHPLAVEFRVPSWLDASHRDGTLSSCAPRIPYVAGRAGGHDTSMPAVRGDVEQSPAVVRHAATTRTGTSRAPHRTCGSGTFAEPSWRSGCEDQGDGSGRPGRSTRRELQLPEHWSKRAAPEA